MSVEALCVCAARRFLLLAMSLVLIAGATAQAAEQVVKNDSFTDGGAAVIVGDFVAGEQAGVRLTSPCAGSIVAVQILWLEGTPGHGQSLEEAIHIYNGSTFPSPGSQLAILEGPVMTPGYINEFRYLDEAQTIPLNVPVTSGQQFYVTLQFANPTDVGNGGPSVCRDTNGCQTGKNVLYAVPGGWYNFCLIISGDLIIRAVINCADPTGACCHASGVCESAKPQSQCQAYGDVWTQGQTCAQVTCTARGACCRAGGCLSLVTPANCAGAGGVYAGNGTNCLDQVCVAGACCMGDGQCVLNFGFQCTGIGGVFQGPGTACSPTNPCPQPTGACCFGDFCIPDQTEADCTGSSGEWAGPFTTCDPNPCMTDPCQGVTFTLGDVNGDGAKDGRDVKDFVAQYIAPTSGTVAFCAANMCAADQVIDNADLAAFVTCLLEPGTCANPGCP